MSFGFNEEIIATCTTVICTATLTQDSIDVPEPATWLLFGTGVGSLLGYGLLQKTINGGRKTNTCAPRPLIFPRARSDWGPLGERKAENGGRDVHETIRAQLR
jgi:hypothetical protein